jgi:hypothetical protein
MDYYTEYGLNLIKYDFRYLTEGDLVLACRAHLLEYFVKGRMDGWDYFMWRFQDAVGKEEAYRIGWIGFNAANTRPESVRWYLLIGDPWVLEAAAKAEQFAQEPDSVIMDTIRYFQGSCVMWEALTMYVDPVRLAYLESAIQLEKMAYSSPSLENLD